MSETKFRPGPWKVEPGDGGYGVKGFSHWSIAQVAEPRFTLAITIGDVSELAAQEIANARLIAAAPDAVALAEEIINHLYAKPDIDRVRQMAREFLAKAVQL